MPASRMFPATAMPEPSWWAELWPDPEDVLRTLGFEPGMTVVDLCCGDGYFTAPLARIVQGAVYAVDLDPHMLVLALGEVERQGAPPCRWICGDARDLWKLVPEQVDYVLLANTFHGVEDKPGLAGELAAVLKPRGRFGIVNWHRRPREETVVLGQPRGPRFDLRMSPEDTRSAVEPAGFELQSFLELPPYHYGSVFRKLAWESE